jgi:hypothetical protein
MPTAIAKEQQDALLETFRAGVRSLGLAGEGSIGAAKGDIKLTPRGPMIGEIAARLSGGYMSGWTYPYSSGVEPVRAAVLAAMGRRPDGLTPLKNWTSAERAFISIPGTVKSVSSQGAAEARSLPPIRDIFFRVEKGSKVSFPENNVSKCGNVISAAPDRTAAVEAAEAAARAVLIRLDPLDGETAAFLSAESVFPPPAFQLDAALRAALSRLPETRPGRGEPRLIPFPALSASGLTDYMGRSVAESLRAIRALTGLSLAECAPEKPAKNHAEIPEVSDNNSTLLGRSFWQALVRGGYQGAVYYIDRELGI